MQTANSLIALRDMLTRAEEALGQSRVEVVESRAKADKAKRALASVERAEELDKVKYQAEAELGHMKERLEIAETTAEAQDLRIRSLCIEVEAAGKRVSSAEEIARESGIRMAEMEDAVRRAEERAAAAEEEAIAAEGKVAIAEERAAKAVEEFRKSSVFAEELAEASSGAYLLGFRDGKEKVGRIHGLSGLDDLEPDESSEEPSPSPRPADIGPPSDGPTEA